MAIKHRKLFPSYAGNDTSPGACNPDVCDQICPYGCDSYPYFYDITPTPPPTPPPLATFSTSPGYHVSPYMIILVTVLSSLFLLVSYYVIIVKYCSSWIFFPRLPRRTQPGGTGEDFLDENHGPAIDHPIWYITTVGLQPSVIDSITVFRYKKGESLIDGTTCSVCLTEFQDDETLRLLPKCNHGFHIRCIDTWLRSHTNCPLCRAVIVSNASAAAAPNSNSLSENQNYSNVNDLNQEDQSVNAENSDCSENNYVRDVEVCEFRAGTEDEIEIPQRVRRSISMDILRGISSSRMTIESEGSCSVDPKTDKQGSDVDENSGIFRMMRSFSYGGRSLLLKHSNRNPNSILPL